MNGRGKGFAAMSPDQRREIASKGGKAAHAKDTAHEYTRAEAIEHGRKGGIVISANREHMANLGRRSADVRRAAKAAKLAPPASEVTP